MKKLFLYCSYTGNGDAVAKAMESKGYEIRKAQSKKKLSKVLFFAMMGGGFRALIGAKEKLIDYDPDVSQYDEIVIGSPIWNARLAPGCNSILAETFLSDKQVNFILYSGSGTGKKAEEKLAKLFPTAKIVFLQQPKDHPDEYSKLNIF